MMRPRLLDLYCCAGGAGTGYSRAGFDVVGVDINPQPHYPFEFHQADAIEFLAAHGREFDVIHASPPCQAYTRARTLADAQGSEMRHPDLLAPTRDALIEIGRPWIIENVPGAPMSNYVELCGSMFSIRTPDTDGTIVQLRRHRWFESSEWIVPPGMCNHDPSIPTASVFGHGGGWKADARGGLRGGYVPHVSVCAALLGVDWGMSKRELSECIPPAYTEWIGAQMLPVLV